ncbi:MAG: hypothetical protein HC888_06745 [Candidatus Competibacteraceae bacterium]|nr:hypothetical protein [Candidatus Competibacteraceae bacterium]
MDVIQRHIVMETERLANVFRERACMYDAMHLEAKGGEYDIVFELTTLWEDKGEKSVKLKLKKGETLQQLIDRVVDKFKKVNDRSDVQANSHMNAVFPSGVHVEIPPWSKNQRVWSQP